LLIAFGIDETVLYIYILYTFIIIMLNVILFIPGSKNSYRYHEKCSSNIQYQGECK